MDKLVYSDLYMKSLKFDGIQILSNFITDNNSLSYAKKKNERAKRWQQFLQERRANGEPDYAEPEDPKILEEIYQVKDFSGKKPVVSKQFYPDLSVSKKKNVKLEKNYISK